MGQRPPEPPAAGIAGVPLVLHKVKHQFCLPGKSLSRSDFVWVKEEEAEIMIPLSLHELKKGILQ